MRTISPSPPSSPIPRIKRKKKNRKRKRMISPIPSPKEFIPSPPTKENVIDVNEKEIIK
jgi:hypothetical protein